MADVSSLASLRTELHAELTRGILPYWTAHAQDARNGGFVGRIDHENHVVDRAEKGAVLNARILWTFSAAYRLLKDESYKRVADRAYAYLEQFFWDHLFQGAYWTVNYRGRPVDDRKHVYAQAFLLYGLSEYYRATGSNHALERAIELFQLVERYSADAVNGGYFEAYSRDWKPLADARLSDKDADEAKSMNTHLHLLEAYTNLYRAWPDALLREKIAALLELFLSEIVDERSSHLVPFFEEDWTPKSEGVSFGHDIEASWLLLEAADVLGRAVLRNRVRAASVAVARVTLREGLDDDGGLFNERCPGGALDADKHWWPQAEALVGFLVAYQETGEPPFLEAALAVWRFIQAHVIDHEHGEWFVRVTRDGRPYAGQDKVEPWKCPYHNARACLEGMARSDALLGSVGASRPGRAERAPGDTSDGR